MIQPKTITITRAEGFIHECGKPATATTWAEANMILRRWSNSAPEHGGYDKCDFTVLFEDGETYNGRYDLVHWKRERPDLAGHVRSFVRYLAGIAPSWMHKDKGVLARYERDCAAHPDRIAAAKKWLETYNVEQVR